MGLASSGESSMNAVIRSCSGRCPSHATVCVPGAFPACGSVAPGEPLRPGVQPKQWTLPATMRTAFTFSLGRQLGSNAVCGTRMSHGSAISPAPSSRLAARGLWSLATVEGWPCVCVAFGGRSSVRPWRRRRTVCMGRFVSLGRF